MLLSLGGGEVVLGSHLQDRRDKRDFSQGLLLLLVRIVVHWFAMIITPEMGRGV